MIATKIRRAVRLCRTGSKGQVVGAEDFVGVEFDMRSFGFSKF